MNEEEALEEIKIEEEKERALNGGVVEEEEKEEKQIVTLEVKKLQKDLNPGNSQGFESICHTWFIVKDKGVPINWSKPLL